jgi:flagellar protein FliS
MTSPRTAYRENDVCGASPSRLVVLLYDQLVQDLSLAFRAEEQGEIELRTQRLNHAILVIGHLQSPLDFEKGGKVAKDLDDYYNNLRQSLVQLQFFPSPAGFGQILTDLLTVREAWAEVERAEMASSGQLEARPAPDPANAEPSPGTAWEG